MSGIYSFQLEPRKREFLQTNLISMLTKRTEKSSAGDGPQDH